jgi:predicted acetyltransferase
MNLTNMQIEVDEYIEPGIRYIEEAPQTVHSLPVRYCYLWPDGVEAPVSELELLSFKQRFGAVSVAAEGIGGVETLPQFRRQGYMSRLLKKAVEGAARWVDVVFVSEAVEGVYEKFGFVNCLVEGHLLLAVRDVEQSLGSLSEPAAIEGVREYTPNDLPEIINLYNEVHRHRPWTHE